MKNRQWLLARRPNGAIQDSDFNFVETDAPTPGEGEVLVRNLMLSCDPTQPRSARTASRPISDQIARGWIAMDTYLPAVKIGEVVRSNGSMVNLRRGRRALSAAAPRAAEPPGRTRTASPYACCRGSAGWPC